MMEYFNYSYPQFTYDELAFPRLELADNFKNRSSTGSISVQLPALRASLDCHPIPRHRVAVGQGAYDLGGTQDIYQMHVTMQADLPKQCQLGGKNGNESNINYTDSGAYDPVRIVK
jgi:hypothetical protein